jgi:hypothetical protein
MKRRSFVQTGLGALAAGGLRGLMCNLASAPASAARSLPGDEHEIKQRHESTLGKPFYAYDALKWLYIGWENDHPKSWTFMGGGLAPGQQPVIQYTVTIADRTYSPDELAPDRMAKIKWHLRDGYLPCPTSEWSAGPVRVEIQHFANRVLNDQLTCVYSRVRLTNSSSSVEKVRLNINVGPTVQVPLSGKPSGGNSGSMYYDISLAAGSSAQQDFVTVASGDMANVLKINKVVNPGFEEDGEPTRRPRGWSTSGDAAAYTAGWNTANYAMIEDLQAQTEFYQQVQVQHSGRYQLVHHAGKDYQASTSQTLTGLPHGTYELRAFVRTAGPLHASRMFARQYSDPDRVADMAGDLYHSLTIPNIHVRGGKCEIGFVTQGDAHTFALIDDVAFYESTGFEARAAEMLKSAGSFDDNYARMAEHYKRRIAGLAHPETLPVPGLADMYKSIQIIIWECMVKSGHDYEIRAGAKTPTPSTYSYDRTFSHDVPNYVDEFMREGDYEVAKKILKSSYYKALNATSWDVNYLDTIGKWMLPYAEYMRATGDLAFFTPTVREELKTAARNIHKCRVFDDPAHYGLMKKGQDFENWENDYLLCDNWGALHGLQAYKYLCDKWGDATESQWAANEMKDLNDCVNKALQQTCARRQTDYYLGAFDDSTLKSYRDSNYSWVPYSGALSTFPWGAYLKGFELGGAWKDRFDASIKYVLDECEKRFIPSGSWGAWWGQITYGSTYNASAGVQCLFSEVYRTEIIKNLEFLLNHQCAPFQWSEAFEYKGRGQWVGMYTPQVSYGNYESWGTNFSKQALLQACISVKTDGTVIIGRGIPDHWLKSGDVIEWASVNVNDGHKLNFRITSGQSEIKLHLSGDTPQGNVRFNLPAFKNNIAAADAGTVDHELGVVTLTPSTRAVTVELLKPPSDAEDAGAGFREV